MQFSFTKQIFAFHFVHQISPSQYIKIKIKICNKIDPELLTCAPFSSHQESGGPFRGRYRAGHKHHKLSSHIPRQCRPGRAVHKQESRAEKHEAAPCEAAERGEATGPAAVWRAACGAGLGPDQPAAFCFLWANSEVTLLPLLFFFNLDLTLE